LIICVKCGHQNGDAHSNCEKCQAQLPRMAQAPKEESGPNYISDRVRELEEASQKVQSGEWSMEKFSEYIDGILQVMNEREQTIRAIEIPPQTIEQFRAELEAGFNGITLYHEGLARMASYAESEDPAVLSEGLELVRKGNDFLNEALRLNYSSQKKYEEMYLDASSMM
jgi:ribosomal protein L40E